MKKITLNDSFRVSDSKMHGVVVVKENGKIIIKKENMIVSSGRSYIKNLLSSKIFTGIIEDRKIDSVKFGTGTNPVFSTNTSLAALESGYNIDQSMFS
jgi:hypothetical protein